MGHLSQTRKTDDLPDIRTMEEGEIRHTSEERSI
jgi:hypothetical protein